MLFKRRNPPSLVERMRVAIWPRRSWSRSVRYVINRVGRLPASAFAVAYGFACGVFSSFSPFVGFHFIIAGFLAWLGGGSILAAALGTFFGNPLTLPVIWISTYSLGSWLLDANGQFNADLLRQGFEDLWSAILTGSWEVFQSALEMLWPLVKPMMVGAVPLGMIVASIFYFAMWRLVDTYKEKRRDQTDQLSRAQHTYEPKYYWKT